MKTLSTVCFSLVLLLATGLHLPQAQAKQAQQVKQAPQTAIKSLASVEGTTWSGIDSDGDRYTFTFLKGGDIRYTTQTPGEDAVTYEDEGDVWAQNGDRVIILIGDYSTYMGTITGDLMKGRSWNVVNKRWSWEFKRAQTNPELLAQ